MRNIKLTLQFDGTAYHGWQMQKNALTVQETLSCAIEKITGSKPQLVGSSRTDAGVHAKKFICNFKTESNIPPDRIPTALNTYLPCDIVCLLAEDEKAEFDSRFSAKKKCYTYYIFNSKQPDAFLHNYSWHFPYDLDISKMKKAAKAFLGKHDFLGFAASGFTVKTTVREIYSLEIDKEGDLIKITAEGDGFLYNMVRIMAGTLAFVGCGKINADEMAEIIASKDRKRAGVTAPPQGLFLTEVYY
ncbi:MAG: tRNA pseudouridine(38-40) synthase TruA [Clostridia bacterium]|nr:tRNA pseudouridine(38-40) synthase TruA [Clostridia bacterium]